MKIIPVILFSFLSFSLWSQQLKKIAKLPEELAEISGLVFYNDSLLIGHNDSGNSPLIYFITLQGHIIHKVKISGAQNTDWEDITTDPQGFIYIGDFGNNNNNRTSFTVYKIDGAHLLEKDSVSAAQIHFSLSEQREFPAPASEKYYDMEALTFYNDSLHIITKCNSRPFDGITYHYILPAAPGNYVLSHTDILKPGTKSYYFDAITGCTSFKNTFYLLTYNKVLKYEYLHGSLTFVSKKKVKRYSQKEAITTKDGEVFFIADEKHKLLGGRNLYQFRYGKK